MFVEVVAAFLGLSLLFYCLFAGADFGGGILELFLGKQRREEQSRIITGAIAPVWEANHVWIILAVVILFNGFPKAFGEISTLFHIPILVMLAGIILRGCAFTFRHYDAVKGRSQKYYSAIFIFSSCLTPLMLGVITGGLFLGRGRFHYESFRATFIDPWFNFFCFSLGIFVCVLFSFLAAVYLVGEAKDRDMKAIFSRKARVANAAAVVCGGFVFLCAELTGFPLLRLFLNNRPALVCLVLATLVLVPLWMTLKSERVWTPRILGALQVFLILMGWFALQYPVILVRNEESLTIYNSAAPELTLHYLFYALMVGTCLIFPALFYLMRIFKKSSQAS